MFLKRISDSPMSALKNDVRKLIPYVPVMSAICEKILNLYMHEDNVAHGYPKNPIDFIHSQHV